MALADIAINIITKGAELAKRQLKGVGDSGDKSSKGINKLSTAMKAGLVAGAVAVGKALAKSTKEFMAFDDAMNQSLAIMNTNEEQQKAMAEQALAVSRTSRIGAEQSAEAFFFLASAGLSAEQSISALPQVAAFAQAGMFDMATATDLATDAQSALGLTVDDAQQNLSNLTRVTDVLVKGNTLANASVQQFSEALTNKAGAALKVVNKSIEEGVAVLAVFADRGVKGAEAGEKLNQLLRDIPRAVAKNKEQFEGLNLQMFDADGKMRNVADIVEELDKVLGPMSDEMKAATLDQLGLNRGVADAVKILSGAGDEIRAYEEALNDSGGTTADVAEKQMGSLKAQVELMTNAFSELGILIGSTIAPALSSIVGFVTKIIQSTSDFIKEQKEQKDAVEESTKEIVIAGQVIKENTHTYNAYSQSMFEARTQTVDMRTATEKAIDAQRGMERANRNSVPSYMKVTDEAIAKAQANREDTETTMEATEASAEYAENIKKNMLPALNDVLSAQNKLKNIQERIKKAEEDRDDASKAVTKAQQKLANATDQVTQARHHFQEAIRESKKVTLEEELAILNAKQAVDRLTDSQDGSREMELKLALAKEKHTELIKASTSATSEQLSAQRDLERALEEEERAFENLTKAQDKLTKAQKELNEVTAKTPENLLEIAMAKKQLDEALTNLNALGSFEDAMGLLVESTGMQLQDLLDMANNIKAGKDIAVDSASGGGGSSGGEVFDTDGTKATGELTQPSFDFTLGQRGGVTTINNIQVAVEGALTDKTNIQDAVAIALLEAQKRGTKVVL